MKFIMRPLRKKTNNIENTGKRNTEIFVSKVLRIKKGSILFRNRNVKILLCFQSQVDRISISICIKGTHFYFCSIPNSITISVCVSCTVSPSLYMMQNSVAVCRTAASKQLPYVTFCVCITKYQDAPYPTSARSC